MQLKYFVLKKKNIWKYRFIQQNNYMLHWRNEQRFADTIYMMTVQTTYFSTPLDDNADTNEWHIGINVIYTRHEWQLLFHDWRYERHNNLCGTAWKDVNNCWQT